MMRSISTRTLLVALCLFVLAPVAGRAASTTARQRVERYAEGLKAMNAQANLGGEVLPSAATLEAEGIVEISSSARSSRVLGGLGRGAGFAARHGMGFLHFSAVLSTYLGARLLIEVEEGRLRPEEMMDVMKEAVASKEALVAYFRFVGVYAVADGIMKKGAGAVAPGLGKQAAELGKLRALAGNFLRHHLLLVAVVTTLDTAEHASHILKGRPWENEENARPDLPWHRAYMSALREDPRRVMEATLGSFAQAFGELDMVDIVFTQAGFVAGMLVASLVPGLGQSGFFQLACGFVAADLASRCLAAPVREGIVNPMKLTRAHEALFWTRRDLFGATSRDWTASQLESLQKQQMRLSQALDADRKKERERFEGCFTTLILASCGKLDNRLSNMRNHFWIDGWTLPGLRLDEGFELDRMPAILAQLREEWSESREAYEKSLQEQMHLLEVLRGSVFADGTGGDFSLTSLRASLEAGRDFGERQAEALPAGQALRRQAARRFHEHLSLEASVLRAELGQLRTQGLRVAEILEEGSLERTLHEAVTARRQALHLERLEAAARSTARQHALKRIDREDGRLETMDRQLTDRFGPARRSAPYVKNFDLRSQRLEELGVEAKQAADSLLRARRNRDVVAETLSRLCGQAMKNGKERAAHAAVLLELADRFGSEVVDGELLAEARRYEGSRMELLARMERGLLLEGTLPRLRLPEGGASLRASGSEGGESFAAEGMDGEKLLGPARLLALMKTSDGELVRQRGVYEGLRNRYNDEVRALFPEDFPVEALGRSAGPSRTEDEDPDFGDLAEGEVF